MIRSQRFASTLQIDYLLKFLQFLYSEAVRLSGYLPICLVSSLPNESQSRFFLRCSDSSNTFDCLATADASVLQDANVQIGLNTFFGTFDLVPAVDGELIVERPVETIIKGKLNAVSALPFSKLFIH